MPVETTVKLKIKCDNPACPGNDLDPTSYEGWIQINAQVMQDNGMGMMFPTTQSYIFCSASCVSAFSGEEATPMGRLPEPEPTPDAPEGAPV